MVSRDRKRWLKKKIDNKEILMFMFMRDDEIETHGRTGFIVYNSYRCLSDEGGTEEDEEDEITGNTNNRVFMCGYIYNSRNGGRFVI